MEKVTKQAALAAETENPIPSIRQAVILAAGKSQRFREKGTKKPKVLLRVGGLRLLERTILTLKEAGIEHFHIVVGAYREQIVPQMQQLPRLKGLDIQFVECPDYELGNGVSFAAGAEGLDDAFLLTMSDHIFDPETVFYFIERATEEPEVPALACDPKLAEVFDMDDATKVVSNDGKIHKIGKELTEYDLVDMGLFYFPKGTGKKIAAKAKAGAHSVSNIVQQFIEETGFRAASLENAFWQDVDDPSMRKEAERRLLRSMIQPADGWVSRRINRHLSTRLSLLLARFGISPNLVTTLVLMLSLLGAYFAASGEYKWIVLGAFIFQLASILDGCDGEVARLTFRSSRLGALFGRLAGNLRYFLFFGALGISAYQSVHSETYLFALIAYAALAFYLLLQLGIFVWKQKGKLPDVFVPKQSARESNSAEASPLERVTRYWRELNKQDVSTFIAFLLCAAFLYKIMFWLSLVGMAAMTITRSKSPKEQDSEDKKSGWHFDPILLYILGLLILSILIYNMDVQVVMESLSQVGNAVFFVFATGILWTLANVACISNLTGHRVPFFDLLYIQVTGDAYNIIIPLAGLGGEPYKIRQLANWMDLHTASRAILQDRLIHSMTGILLTTSMGFLAVIYSPLSEKIRAPMLIVSIVLTIAAGGIIWVTLSNAPSRFSGYVLKKLKFLEEYKNEPLSTRSFLISFGYKMLGRYLFLVELWVIFLVMGYSPSWVDMITVAAMLTMTASLFFIIPSGLGVNEAGISSAFVILGYSATLGLTFGLLRRARMIFWALLGVTIHLTVSLARKIALSRVAEK